MIGKYFLIFSFSALYHSKWTHAIFRNKKLRFAYILHLRVCTEAQKADKNESAVTYLEQKEQKIKEMFDKN
jgi:hypothetical protein